MAAGGTERSGNAEVQGPEVEVRRSARRTRTVTAFRERNTIVVLIPARMSKADEVVFVEDMVAKVLAREARSATPRGSAELMERAQDLSEIHLAPALGRTPLPHDVLWVTNQNRRWGSCTPSTRVIRLSHRLQPMPSWVVDYVLLHELAHLVEADHSPAFWRLVDRFPSAERAKGFLEGYQSGQAQTPQSVEDSEDRFGDHVWPGDGVSTADELAFGEEGATS